MTITASNQPPTGEPRLASWASWMVLAASFGLSASTWIALGELAGFTSHLTIAVVTVRLAWLMPIAVDGYVVVALVLWMAPVPARVAAFAKKNTYGAAGIGIAAQSAYHLLFTLSTTDQWWKVILAAIVGALPPAVAGLAVHMRALIRREITTTHAATPVPAAVQPSIEPRPLSLAVADPIPAPNVMPVVVASVPTPAQVAPRITSTATSTRPAPAPVPGTAARPDRPRSSTPQASPTPFVPPSTDIHVTAQAATQPTSPLLSPALLARATHVARQYRTEHATPITSGQLALRLRVTSEQAAQLLARIDHNTTSTTLVPATVNGHRIEAAH